MGHEALNKAVSATSLAWKTEESQVDRVTAIGMGSKNNELGAAIIHAESLDRRAIVQVINLVAHKLINRVSGFPYPAHFAKLEVDEVETRRTTLRCPADVTHYLNRRVS